MQSMLVSCIKHIQPLLQANYSTQGFSHLEPVKTFATSNDDVGPSMIAALGLRRSRIRTKPIITTIGMSQILFMPSVSMGDLEAPATQVTEGLHSS